MDTILCGLEVDRILVNEMQYYSCIEAISE